MVDAPTPSAVAPNRAPPTPPVGPPPEYGRSRSTTWVAAGVGLAALATGTYFGLKAFALKHDAQSECHGSACTSYGLGLYEDVDRAATASTIAFSIGILSTGFGIYLLVREPPHPQAGAGSPVALRRRDTYAGISWTW